MVTPLEVLISWLAFPVYVWQGLGVRRRSTRLAPPQTDGRTQSSGRHRGKPLSILLIGDSSAAGVGAQTIGESLGGRLPDLLAARLDRPVHLRIAGNNSATSGQIRDHVVPHLEAEPYDYVCLNIGTNDAKNFHSGRRFRREFGTLLYALKSRWPGATIIWGGVLDLETVPALPTPLNRILGIRSRIIDHNGKTLCRERGALAPVSEWNPAPENFAVDGFHASARGYGEWAEGLAAYIAELECASP
ncbi:MAG: SGNH/GDSL hydrolase family protein [Nitratireductor sp.]|nr:SGNH/GDSL hydrolase family protein [Nitratireductor sp.]